jgi:hypothetical protein
MKPLLWVTKMVCLCWFGEAGAHTTDRREFSLSRSEKSVWYYVLAAPREIRRLLPNVKLMLLLRDPGAFCGVLKLLVRVRCCTVERTFSDFVELLHARKIRSHVSRDSQAMPSDFEQRKTCVVCVYVCVCD